MIVQELYEKYIGVTPASIEPLTPAGSSRRYFRLKSPGHPSVIGVEGVDVNENRAFIYLTQHLSTIGVNVPELLAESDDLMTYLISDLGDTQLFSMLDDSSLLHKAMAQLAIVHSLGSMGMKWDICFPVEEMNMTAAMWDLNYFKYSFLNTEGIVYSEPRLEMDFERIAKYCEDLSHRDAALMLRDFQSRNVMVRDGKVWLIDYQGARRGPRAYDLASFLWQAKARFSPERRSELINSYCDSCEALGVPLPDRKELHRQVEEMALLRSLQVLGAYGLRGRFERKPHFLQSIPLAIDNLRQLSMMSVARKYPYLFEVINQVIAKEDDRIRGGGDARFDGLTVSVRSFSYKKGLPDDPSGNGGGFVFDCRAMDNPGRYESYKQLTGLDKDVCDFLEQRGEIQLLLADAESIVDRVVDNYIERRFTSLSVSFGCTGGQHRSVYCAQAMAEHLHEKYPEIRVHLLHREQGIATTFTPKHL